MSPIPFVRKGADERSPRPFVIPSDEIKIPSDENYFLFEINSENKKIQAEFYLNEGKFVVEIDHLINMLDTTQILLTRKENEKCKIGSFLVVNNNEVVSIFTQNNSLFAKGLKKGNEFLFQICFGEYINYLLPIYELKSILMGSIEFFGNRI